MLYAVVDTASSGDNEVVAAVTGKRIRVVAFVLVAAGAVTARWKSGAGTNLTGAMSLITGVPVTAAPMPATPASQQGHFEAAQGSNLTINLGGAVQVSGHVAYTLE